MFISGEEISRIIMILRKSTERNQKNENVFKIQEKDRTFEMDVLELYTMFWYKKIFEEFSGI